MIFQLLFISDRAASKPEGRSANSEIVLSISSISPRDIANPELQSQKFLKAFTAAPFPRMTETWFMLKGMFVIGLFLAGSFIYINDKIEGGWIVKGLKIGILFFAVAIPWFEFYLPYNIMLEPLPLVLFEVLVWFGVYSLLWITMSFILNYRRKN